MQPDFLKTCFFQQPRDASPPLVLAFLQAPNAATKRYHQTLPQDASSNGGDASRVGIEKGEKYERY